MNAERLIAHYGRIADSPDAIASLRRLILDLACRGKLVPQDATDDPASKLLARIVAEKARLVKSGGIKSPKPTIALAAIPFSLPVTWLWSRIAEIGVLSPRNEAPDEMNASFVPMPLIPAEYAVASKHEIRPWGDIKKGYTHFAEGDVGLAKITPCFENGKSTVFRNLTGGIGSGTTELHIVRPLFVDQDYILIFFKSPYFIETGIPKMTGTVGQKRVPTEYFAHTPFPLPPLAEQRRIVAKVDELMALCNELETARTEREATRDRLVTATFSRLNAPNPETFQEGVHFALNVLPAITARPDQIKHFRQIILNLAMRGTLVAQNPNEELATETLKQIASERAELVKQKIIRREDPLPAAELKDQPFPLPATWTWARIGDLALFTQYGTSEKARPVSEGVPVLTMGNIQGGAVVVGGEKKIAATSEELPGLYLKRFDLLYNRTNSAELVGKTGIYLGESDTTTFASYLIRVRCSQIYGCAQYLNLAMNTPDFRRTQVVPLIKKQTGQANVNGTFLKQMLVPVPPLAEQWRIVAKVDELLSLCNQLEVSLAAGQKTRSRLLETLLHETFEPVDGDTVPVQTAA